MDYKSKSYDKPNEGVLFANEEDWKVTHQGKLDFDGENHRIFGLSRKNKNKEPILELYIAIGTLKQNINKAKTDDPDAKGVVNKTTFKGAKIISSWKNISEGGNHYTKLALRDFTENKSDNKQSDTSESKKEEEQKEKTSSDFDDEIPF